MRINLIVLRTKNIDELSGFYEKLGIRFEYHRHGNGPAHYSAVLEETVFEIYPLQKNQEKPDDSLRLGFGVEALDALILKLKSDNIVIENGPVESEWGYFAVVKDLDGRRIELKEI